MVRQTAEGLDPGAVPEPAKREDGLVTACQLPAPGRGAAEAALAGQEPGQVANQSRGVTSVSVIPGKIGADPANH